MSEQDPVTRLQELLERLELARKRSKRRRSRSGRSTLCASSPTWRRVQAEIERARRGKAMRALEDLRGLVEDALGEASVRARAGRARAGAPLFAARRREAHPSRPLPRDRRGARPRSVRASAGRVLSRARAHVQPRARRPSRARRRRPSARPGKRVRFGEGVAILAGDALLTEAFRLRSRIPLLMSRASSPKLRWDDRWPVHRHHE